eukprot:scaffold61871_cov65-Phaeocystis_antarctica.AAC.5
MGGALALGCSGARATQIQPIVVQVERAQCAVLDQGKGEAVCALRPDVVGVQHQLLEAQPWLRE